MQSRRGLIGAMVGLAALLAGGAPALARLRRVSKARAHYQDKPKDIQSCASCALFKIPNGCKAVIGKVSPDGWCSLFEMVD